jgi:hypothetical protein
VVEESAAAFGRHPQQVAAKKEGFVGAAEEA